MCVFVSKGETMGVWLLGDQGVPASCVCGHMRDSLYQQLERDYGLGGFYIQVTATGETAILGLATGQSTGGICIVHMHRYILTGGPPSC